MPLEVRLTFADGSIENTRLPVEAWFEGNHFTYVRIFPKELIKVEIDPDKNFPTCDGRTTRGQSRRRLAHGRSFPPRHSPL